MANLMLGRYNSVAPTLVDTYTGEAQFDINGNLKVTMTASTADAILVDDAAFTPATSNVDVVGFLADETATDSVDEGDIGAARMTLNRRLIPATAFLDDTAYGVATDYTNATGFLADETATDSVNEGDIGIARITLDRRQIMAGQILDDAAFGIGTEYVQAIGALVDDTATDSVDEGDIGLFRMSADRILYIQGALAHDAVDANNPIKIGFKAYDPAAMPADVAASDRANGVSDLKGRQYVYNATTLDSTNDSISTIFSTHSNINTSAAAASLVIKASAGRLISIRGYNAKASAQFIQIHDASSLPADTAVPEETFTVAASSNFSIDFLEEKSFTTGIVVSNSSTMATKTIGSADCWFSADYR